MCVYQLIYDNMCVYQLIYDNMYVSQLIYDNMYVSQLIYDNMYVYQLIYDNMYVYQLIYDNMYVYQFDKGPDPGSVQLKLNLHTHSLKNLLFSPALPYTHVQPGKTAGKNRGLVGRWCSGMLASMPLCR